MKNFTICIEFSCNLTVIQEILNTVITMWEPKPGVTEPIYVMSISIPCTLASYDVNLIKITKFVSFFF